MDNAENYILTSDFATMGGSPTAVGTITLPEGISVLDNATYNQTTDVSLVGSGQIRSLITSSKVSGRAFPVNLLSLSRNWSGWPTSTVISVFRLNSNTVRISLQVYNVSGGTIVSPAGNEVFTVSISEVVMPF